MPGLRTLPSAGSVGRQISRYWPIGARRPRAGSLCVNGLAGSRLPAPRLAASRFAARGPSARPSGRGRIMSRNMALPVPGMEAAGLAQDHYQPTRFVMAGLVAGLADHVLLRRPPRRGCPEFPRHDSTKMPPVTRPTPNRCYRAAMHPLLIDAIGTAGALLTTLCWLPQVWKILALEGATPAQISFERPSLRGALGVGLWLVLRRRRFLASGRLRSPRRAITLAVLDELVILRDLKLRHGSSSGAFPECSGGCGMSPFIPADAGIEAGPVCDRTAFMSAQGLGSPRPG